MTLVLFYLIRQSIDLFTPRALSDIQLFIVEITIFAKYDAWDLQFPFGLKREQKKKINKK